MKRPLSILTTVMTLLAVVSYFDIVSAQGRGAGAGGRGRAPVATPAKPPTAGRPAPARPQGPPPIAEPAARGRGRSQTPPAVPAEATGRGRGEAAGRIPPEAVGRGGRGEAAGNGAEQVPIWARERRPPTAGELVAHNPQLAARLQTLLPGADLQVASSGFSNLGQFVAAVHVSENLGIPFDQVKAKMVGENLTLGDAIQALRPEADADAAAGRAEGQARANMRDVRDN